MRYAILFFGQFANYTVAVLNIRAASHAKIWLTGLTDLVFCVVNFYLIQKVATAHSPYEMLCYGVGGALGAMFAVWLTKHWNAQEG